MLVEFSELLDRNELSPAATNMTVEAMPNDNLVRTSINKSQVYLLQGYKVGGKVVKYFLHCISISPYAIIYFQLLTGEMTFTLNFKMRLSRPVRDEMILRKMSENISMINIDTSNLIFLQPQ